MLWLAHLAAVQGSLLLDDGAVKAVRDRRTSLLPAGITAVHGHFEAGDAVEMVAADGTVIARGLVNYSSAELPQMLGRSTQELAETSAADMSGQWFTLTIWCWSKPPLA